MSKIRLNRVSRGAQIQVVTDQQFYSRLIEVTSEEEAVINKLEADHAIMRTWMDKAYNANTMAHNPVHVEFPKELLPDDKAKQDTTASKKAGTKKRVRAGGSGAVAASGS